MVPDETISFVDGHMGPYAENLAQDCGDFYLRRADGVFAYQLAVDGRRLSKRDGDESLEHLQAVSYTHLAHS